MITAKVIADSISVTGKRITTLQLCYPRFIHAEFMTHRVFSRNASSSRAIPVMKMLAQVWNDPATPIHWGQNQAGMQAKGELTGFKKAVARSLWKFAGRLMCGVAYSMNKVGLHKQVANRILEPWQNIHVVLTATEFDNWDALRDHPDADPNICELARVMKIARYCSTPVPLLPGHWHLPYVTDVELDRLVAQSGTEVAALVGRKVSAARCCRVSYLKHDGSTSMVEEDLLLCERLAGAAPIHASPFEHQATPDVWHSDTDGFSGYEQVSLHGNFEGWIQHRKLVELDFKS